MQGCNQRVVLERAAEHTELHGAAVCEIDGGVASRMASALGMVEDLPWLLLIAVPRRPLVELRLCAAGEFKQLVPELFKEVQHAGDGRILLGFRFAECRAVDMDVQAASPRLMRGVAHLNGFCHDLLPRHFAAMEVERHGVCNDLEAIVKRTVMLAVGKRAPDVGDVHDAFGVGITFARLVDFQLHAEEAVALAIEDGLRLVVIVVHTTGNKTCVASVTVCFIAAVAVVGIFLSDHLAAACTVSIVVVIAVLTQRRGICAGVFTASNSLAAVRAEDRPLVQTVGAEKFIMEWGEGSD